MKAGCRRIGIDATGSFWEDNLRGYVKEGGEFLRGLEELVVYDTRGKDEWKGSAYLERFRRVVENKKKDLIFSELGEDWEAKESLRNCVSLLRTLWDVKGGEGDEELVEDYGPKPVISICELELREPEVQA